MPHYVVGEPVGASRLKARLEREMARLDSSGAAVEVREELVGDAVYYTCVAAPKDPQESPEAAAALESAFKAAIARAVSQTIVRDLELQLLWEHLRASRPHYREAEAGKVVARARRQLLKQAREGRSARNEVFDRVSVHIREQGELRLDGFVRFRLKRYTRELQACLNSAIRRHEAELEHAEFVELLKQFLDFQEPSVEELHILPDGNGSFSLADRRGSSVDDGYLEAFLTDLAVDGYIDREELLVSALVTLAPTRVHCHLRGQAWNLRTLQAVLADRIEYCDGCALCRSSSDSERRKAPNPRR